MAAKKGVMGRDPTIAFIPVLMGALVLTEVDAAGLMGVFVPAEIDDVTDPVAAFSVFCRVSAVFRFVVGICFRSFCCWMVPSKAPWSDDLRTDRRVGSGGRLKWRCGVGVSEASD